MLRPVSPPLRMHLRARAVVRVCGLRWWRPPIALSRGFEPPADAGWPPPSPSRSGFSGQLQACEAVPSIDSAWSFLAALTDHGLFPVIRDFAGGLSLASSPGTRSLALNGFREAWSGGRAPRPGSAPPLASRCVVRTHGDVVTDSGDRLMIEDAGLCHHSAPVRSSHRT